MLLTRVLVEERPKLLVARVMLTGEFGRAEFAGRFVLLVGRAPAPVAATTPRPENTAGRVVAAMVGRPLFTEAN